MPGIGVRTGARILLEVGDATAFPTSGHLAAYAGLAPVTRRSGTSIRGEHPVPPILCAAGHLGDRAPGHATRRYSLTAPPWPPRTTQRTWPYSPSRPVIADIRCCDCWHWGPAAPSAASTRRSDPTVAVRRPTPLRCWPACTQG